MFHHLANGSLRICQMSFLGFTWFQSCFLWTLWSLPPLGQGHIKEAHINDRHTPKLRLGEELNCMLQGQAFGRSSMRPSSFQDARAASERPIGPLHIYFFNHWADIWPVSLRHSSQVSLWIKHKELWMEGRETHNTQMNIKLSDGSRFNQENNKADWGVNKNSKKCYFRVVSNYWTAFICCKLEWNSLNLSGL